MKKILCVGEALIDMICTNVGRSLMDGEQFVKKPGGAPTNVAAAIAALGSEVDLAAKVGRDPFGKHLIQTMESFGVGTQWMLEDAAHFTTFAFVSLFENGERDFFFNRGADGQLSMLDLQHLNLADYGMIHFGSATGFLPGPLQETYVKIFEQAKSMGLYISFDPNFRHLLFPNGTEDFIAQSIPFIRGCNFFKVSDEEALLLTGETSITAACEKFSALTDAHYAITLGSKGTLICHKETAVLVPSIEIESIDSTGAGDAFVGAVLHQLIQIPSSERNEISIEKWQHIVANGNKAGAKTCMHLGAMEAFKHLTHTIFE